MATIDWMVEPHDDDERALRAEVIRVVTEDGFAALGGHGDWGWVHMNLCQLCARDESLVASDLREAIQHARERSEAEREVRRAREVASAIERAQARLLLPRLTSSLQ